MKRFLVLVIVAATGISMASYTSPYSDGVGTVALWHMNSVRSFKYVDDDDSVVTDRNANLILAPNPINTAGGPALVDPSIAGFAYPAGNSAFGTCLYFDGVDDSSAIGNATLNFNPADVRVESWFKADAALNGQYLFDRYGQLVVISNATNLSVMAAGQVYNFDYSTAAANPTTWTHYAVEVVGTDMEVFLNGISVGSIELPSALLAPSKTTTYVGVRYNSATTGLNKFVGYIDEVRISQATPEPATLALLGLGALCLRRRK